MPAFATGCGASVVDAGPDTARDDAEEEEGEEDEADNDADASERLASARAKLSQYGTRITGGGFGDSIIVVDINCNGIDDIVNNYLCRDKHKTTKKG